MRHLGSGSIFVHSTSYPSSARKISASCLLILVNWLMNTWLLTTPKCQLFHSAAKVLWYLSKVVENPNGIHDTSKMRLCARVSSVMDKGARKRFQHVCPQSITKISSSVFPFLKLRSVIRLLPASYVQTKTQFQLILSLLSQHYSLRHLPSNI